MRSSLLPVKVIVLIPFLFCCSPKNIQHSGKAEKAGEIRTDTVNKSSPAEYKQRVIHNSDDQKTVDSLKTAREKRK
ncbi:MAG: hypothetical protein NTX43_04950 [Bacteroidetes bacterium]|nr:hypothetical protein [Bacteroidota bacterium]